MNSRLTSGALALAALAAQAVAQPASVSTPTRKPNVVYILCDDLGIGDVGAFNPTRGKIPTPNIDRLASDGMRFTDAHSASALCTPSRYALLTGRYSWRSHLQAGVLGGWSEPLLSAERPTVATFLREQGYATACIGKWHLGLTPGEDRFKSPLRDGPLQHGFDRFFGIAASLDMAPFAWIDDDRFPEAPSVQKKFGRTGMAAPSFEAVDVLPTLTTKAVDYIKTHGNVDAKPYFLYLPLTSPHTPIVPTAEWHGKSGLGDYGDFVMQTDATVGAVLKAIDDSGQRDNTIVCFASDNGFAPPGVNPKVLEALGHYPSAEFRGYKTDIWDGGHRIPFIVRWPAVVKPGTQCSQFVGLIDLFGTIADVLQQKLPDNAAVDSFSLLPLLKGSDAPVRTYDIYHSGDGYFAIREGDWKLELCAGSGGWALPTNTALKRNRCPRCSSTTFGWTSENGTTFNRYIPTSLHV
ncbi:MAG: arylsulfatase [Tepidisphaeraceae bacterium]